MRTSSNVEVEAPENNGTERENRNQNVTECEKWKSERILTNPRRHAGVGKKRPTGHDATDVFWGFGVDPDQGVPGGFGFGTTNVISGNGSNLASVTATSANGYTLELRNVTGSNAGDIHTYVDPTTCCSPVDPLAIHLAAQADGSYGFSDSSINIAYTLGHYQGASTHSVMHNGDSSVVGYELVMGAVPEPETYAMFMAGLGLMGFIARRRRNGQA